jgi:hypothetical protein
MQWRMNDLDMMMLRNPFHYKGLGPNLVLGVRRIGPHSDVPSSSDEPVLLRPLWHTATFAKKKSEKLS